MLENKPYFTWRIETKGALYEGKINGILLEEDFSGATLAFEQPVNQYMRTGKNRISMHLYPDYSNESEGFGNAQISISLYVNEYDAPEQEKKLIGQINFNATELAQGKKGIESSMPAKRLDSTDDFKVKESGDVIIHSAVIEDATTEPDGIYIYQDVEVKTPFPEWVFFNADKIKFPDSFQEFSDNLEHYKNNLIAPLYDVHKNIFNIIKTEDMDKILPLFEERNREYDIAFYYDKGTQAGIFKKELEKDFNNTNEKFKMDGLDRAQPTVSDEKNLMFLGGKSLIYFHNEEDSTWTYYKIWLYQKDGKWIISR